MAETSYEIRDPVHATIRFDSSERRAVDSCLVQRLRYIRQLGLTCLLYPGASHSRFEHSLGAMELAGRLYDSITGSRDEEQPVDLAKLLPKSSEENAYWRRALRMAALCHDIGHLPFSHAAEEILPREYSHERLTADLIQNELLLPVWKDMQPELKAGDIAKLAVGNEKWTSWGNKPLTRWERILSEIITGDAFGVDRMDYLLRDSYHVGVAYGHIDHHRLIDTIRILPRSEQSPEDLTLGIRQGGLPSAEAMMLARYFMFKTVYCHPVSQIYALYLLDFMREWYPRQGDIKASSFHLSMTDNEVLASIRLSNHDSARRIVERRHFALLYEPPQGSSGTGKRIYQAACEIFPKEQIRRSDNMRPYQTPEFPVLRRDDKSIALSTELSEILKKVPSVAGDYVYVDPSIYDKAAAWLKKNRKKILGVQITQGNKLS
jgi:HD superfamily phosphohydrolase